MAFTNFDTKEINCKIIYFGAPASGKTANLRSVYASTASEIRSGLMEFADTEPQTPFFDFLPVSLGQVKDFHLKMHLFTIPVNSLYKSVPSVILKGVDGVIFVADSRLEALADTLECFYGMRKILADEGYNAADLPRVFQYNKRDHEDIVPLDVMRAELNPGRLPDYEAVATRSIGTMETLHSMAKQVIQRLAHG